jgi:hypothetical protein
VLSRFESFMNLGQVVPHSMPTTPAGTPNKIGKEDYTTIILVIISLTHLHNNFGNPSFELIFVGDLTPIPPEEMPPLNFFFSKK